MTGRDRTPGGGPGEGARAVALLGLVCRRVSDAPSVLMLLCPRKGDVAKKSFTIDPSAHYDQLKPRGSSRAPSPHRLHPQWWQVARRGRTEMECVRSPTLRSSGAEAGRRSQHGWGLGTCPAVASRRQHDLTEDEEGGRWSC